MGETRVLTASERQGLQSELEKGQSLGREKTEEGKEEECPRNVHPPASKQSVFDPSQKERPLSHLKIPRWMAPTLRTLLMS